MVKSPKPQTPKKTAVRVVSDSALNDLINKKQCKETLDAITKSLLEKPNIAAKILSLLRSGAFDETGPASTDRVPSSTNKFNLLSRDHLLDILEYILQDSTASIKTRLAHCYKKTDLCQLLCYATRVETTCALPCRQLSVLKMRCKTRVVIERLTTAVATIDLCKPKGSKAMVMDFNKSGVYSFTDWCDQKQRFKTVKHNLSGAKACLPDQHHTPCHQQAGILHIYIGFSHRHCYFTPMSSAIKFTSHCNYMDTFPTLVTLGCMRTRVLDRALIEHSRHVNSCTIVESQLV